ncbi:MAG: hypothetical protein ACRYFS_18335 [Janthinobacterium lividum]
MERRDSDAGSGLETANKSKAWQAVRRALGRLVSHVGVRAVPEDERTIPALTLQADLALPPPSLSPKDTWKPSATVRMALVPKAGTGMQESDLLPTVVLAQGDYAVASPGIQTMPIASAETVGVESLPLEWQAEVTHLPESFLHLPSSPVRIGTTGLLPLPKTIPLRGWQVQREPVRLLRLPPLPAAPVRWGSDSVLRRMPLTRRAREMGANVLPPEVFAGACRRLAETVHLKTEEVTLLGIYPDVPILAVERIVVEDEGRQLKLWIKPEILRGRTASHRITLLVGRQISTGKMLQAAL